MCEYEPIVTVELNHAAALVLANLLFRWDQSPDDRVLRLEHDAEWHALSMLEGALDRQLVEIFRPDYDRLVEAARDRLVERGGSVEHWQRHDG
jgi:hypothetical protein